MADWTSVRNIGAEMARTLGAAGIDSPEKLREEGAKQAYFKRKTLYPNVCLVHLYALGGAIRGVELNRLPKEAREELRKLNEDWKDKGGFPR